MGQKQIIKKTGFICPLLDPSIEYYGLKVIGDDESLDKQLMAMYPGRIELSYSKTQRRSYPMNLCEHSGSKQDWYFVYRYVNEEINNIL